jgi:putative transposase
LWFNFFFGSLAQFLKTSETLFRKGLVPMPRKKLIRSYDLPYHLTARVNNREVFPGDLEYVWQLLTSELFLQQIVHSVYYHAFVMMPNHFHLLATSPLREIDLVMKEVLGSTTRTLNSRYGRSGHIFGGRYFWSLIREPDYYAHAMKYVLRNPVKAGLCTKVSDYPFGTYSGLMGEIYLPLAITPPTNKLARLIPEETQALDDWLNTPHTPEQYAAIQKAVRRKVFEFAPTKNARRKPNLTI